MDAKEPAAQSPRELSERLRQLGLDCAASINADPSSWMDVAEWLRTIPINPSTIDRRQESGSDDASGDLLAVVGLDAKPIEPDSPLSQRYNVYDNEAKLNKMYGPVLRRLLEGWEAATSRFFLRERSDDPHYDFGLEDARRITFLAALTLNKDFDGGANGIGWPWAKPPECESDYEGREIAAEVLTYKPFNKKTLIELIEMATGYLRKTPVIDD